MNCSPMFDCHHKIMRAPCQPSTVLVRSWYLPWHWLQSYPLHQAHEDDEELGPGEWLTHAHTSAMAQWDKVVWPEELTRAVQEPGEGT